MLNWSRIPQNDCDKIWHKFYTDFSFKPSSCQADWPSIRTSKPNVKLKITDMWSGAYDETKWLSLIQKGINSFCKIVDSEEEIIVLDWQHECYYINPRKIDVRTMLPTHNTSGQKPSFIPDGEYYIFITKDFENVWFGHPWEKTITIIGDKLIHACGKQ